MAEYASDCLDINMEVNEDDFAVEEETAVNGTMDLGKSKTVDPEDFQKLSLPLEIMRIMQANRDTKMVARANREVVDKIERIFQECSSDPEVKGRLLSVCVRLEGERRTAKKFVASNRHCSQLKKVWINRGLPVDSESLQSAAASKDASGMGSFNESPPLSFQYGEVSDEIKSKAKRWAKEIYDFIDEKKLAIARSQITRFLASNNPEWNNNLPSCSSNVQQPITLTNMVKKVCRDMRNIQRFSSRPMFRTQEGPYGSSNSSMNSNRMSVPGLRKFPLSHEDEKFETQNLDGESNFDPPQQFCEGEKHTVRQPPVTLNMNCDGRCGMRCTLRLQKSRENVLLDRQMSRLNIANSRRGDLSQDMDESEMKDASDQNKDERDKATIETPDNAHLRALLDRLKDPNIDEEEKAAIIKQRNAHMRALLKHLREKRQQHLEIGNKRC